MFLVPIWNQGVNNLDNEMHATYMIDPSQNSGFLHHLSLCCFPLQVIGLILEMLKLWFMVIFLSMGCFINMDFYCQLVISGSLVNTFQNFVLTM